MAVACPPEASLLACDYGFDHAIFEHRTKSAKLAIEGAPLVDRVIAELIAVGVTSFSSYVAARARVITELIAVRLRLAGCELEDLTHSDVLGDEVAVSREANTLLVEPPRWARATDTKPIRVACVATGT